MTAPFTLGPGASLLPGVAQMSAGLASAPGRTLMSTGYYPYYGSHRRSMLSTGVETAHGRSLLSTASYPYYGSRR